MHPARGPWRLRLAYGGWARRLPAAAGLPVSGRLSGRDQPTSLGRSPYAAACGTGTAGAARSGVRAGGRGQLLPRHRATPWVAAGAPQPREVVAWGDARNGAASAIAWRFTTSDARITLTRLYPVIHPCRTTRAARSEVADLAPRRVDIRPKVGPARETPSAGRTLLQMNGRLHPLASMELGELLPVNADIDRDLPAGSVRVEAVERPIGRE